MLSADELSDLQALQEEAMPDACDIYRKTVSSSGGVRTPTRSLVETTKCRKRTSSSREPEERAIADRMGVVVAYIITLPAGTDVRESDELEIGGLVYEVGGILRRSYETGRMVVCKEIARA